MIKWRNRMKQLVNFKGMQEGKMHPTDVDALIEWKNKAYVIMEVKYNGKEMTKSNGQRIFMQRFINDISKHKKGIAIICDHYIHDPEIDYNLGDCIVREIYLSDENYWRPPNRIMRVEEIAREFIEWVEKNDKI